MRIVLDRKKALFIIQNLRLRDLRTFLALAFMAGDEGAGEATLNSLADQANLTILSVSQALPRLVAFDLIGFKWEVHMGKGAKFGYTVNRKWIEQ